MYDSNPYQFNDLARDSKQFDDHPYLDQASLQQLDHLPQINKKTPQPNLNEQT